MHRAKGDRLVRASGLPVRQWVNMLQQDTINLSDRNHIIFDHKGQSDIDEGK